MSILRQPSENHGCNKKNMLSMFEKLPDVLILEILKDLDLESLFSVACVSKGVRSNVSNVLMSQNSLDLSFLSPDVVTVNHIYDQLGGYQHITLDCLRLDNFTINKFLGRHIQELNLLKCARVSDQIFFSIAASCPDLRVLVLELGGISSLQNSGRNLACMLQKFSHLESLCIKIRGTGVDEYGFKFIELSLPKTIEVLKLKPIKTDDAIRFLAKLTHDGNSIALPLISSPTSALKSLSFQVDYVDDVLIILITNCLPHLVDLDLEDRPIIPLGAQDLTNHGLQSLGTCRNLSTLSLVRSRRYLPVSFNKVNDMGMFLLSECCKGLRSIKLGGFTKVSDAGFSSIFHSCRNLEKFEIGNAPLLSDLAFQDVGSSISGSLVSVKLWSCGLVTSDTVTELSSCFNLEVLNFSVCKSIADGCLRSISSLRNLTTLNLEGADITDIGMGIIGSGSLPITNLCLRGCKRISHKGVYLLLCGGGIIGRTLTSLDIGFIANMSDEAVSTIAAFGLSITELSIRNCYFITGTSLKDLGSEKRFEEGKKLIRKLDLYNCVGVTFESLETVRKPLFRGLRWLGVGSTKWHRGGRNKLTQIVCEERPWLTVCLEGCQMGCDDGWQFHTSEGY